MNITSKQLKILESALGFDHIPRYRQNYYVGQVDSTEWKDVLILEYLGYLERRFDGGGNLVLFGVTSRGKDIVRQWEVKLDEVKKRDIPLPWSDVP